MIFELVLEKDFYQHFGDGYCMEMPASQNRLDRLLNFLYEQNALWRFYAIFSNGIWFHGIHIVFPKNADADSAIQDVCKWSGSTSYCAIENGTQTVFDTDGDVIAFADFTEGSENKT